MRLLPTSSPDEAAIKMMVAFLTIVTCLLGCSDVANRSGPNLPTPPMDDSVMEDDVFAPKQTEEGQDVSSTAQPKDPDLTLSPVGFGHEHVVKPKESTKAFANPLKGFRPDLGSSHPYGTLIRHYIKWNDLENYQSDGVDKIRNYCNAAWAGLPTINAKVIPRVFLHWPVEGSGNGLEGQHWPADMTPGDYSSPQFKQRLVGLIAKLGQAWDNDPRVAWVETAIFGKWGEQHSPEPSQEMQQIMGDAYQKAFTHKHLLNRTTKHFWWYPWGFYWDAFGCAQQAQEMKKAGNRWQFHPYEGEIAYNFCTPAGSSPLEDVSNPAHYNKIAGLVHDHYTTALGWISVAPYNSTTAKGIDTIQKAFGYRYVIQEARYPAGILHGETLTAKLRVLNVGSAPFYYRWPYELSLLDPKTRAVVWRQIVQTSGNMDLTQYLPGLWGWDFSKGRYNQAPYPYSVTLSGVVPSTVPKGQYILAVAVLDPAGNLPSLRFAIENYFKGGRHPMGMIGVGEVAQSPYLDPTTFDDPREDDSLHYIVP